MSYLFVLVNSVVLTIIVGLSLLAMASAARKSGALWAFWGGALLIHLLWWRLPDLDGVWSSLGRWLVSVWIGALLMAVLLIIPFALFLLGRRLAGRRGALGPRATIVFSGISLGVGAAASFGTIGDPVVREEVISVPGLPPPLDGVRIANIGDVHVGRFILPADLARAVEIVNARHVDLLTITGDLVDDLTQIEATLDALALSRTRPVLSILGNHDKSIDEAALVAAVHRRSSHIDLLVNSSVLINVRGGSVRVVGADYPLDAHGGHMLARREQDAAMLEFANRAFVDSTPGETIIALSHHPDFFKFAAERGAVLTLASHTHGGQVSIFGRPLIAAYDYMHGLYRLGGAHLDVSAGVGHWLPVRIGVPREIVIVTLLR